MAAARDLVSYAPEARERVIRALQKALRDEAAQVRAAAATALADAGGSEALPDLLVAVEDDNPLVRQMAISALGEIGDARATERLRRALADPRAEVRFQAVMAFPRVSASRDDALAALLHATEDEDAFVCHIALRMTEELRDGDALDPRVLRRARVLLAHASPEVRVASAILLALRHDGGPGGSPIPRQISDPQSRARSRAFRWRSSPRSGGGELRTGDREDEAAAIELCGDLGLTTARPGLERRAFGGLLGLRRDPLAWHARVALARMGHERACREILRELGDRDRDVCTLAVAAAGRARLGAHRERILAQRGEGVRVAPHAGSTKRWPPSADRKCWGRPPIPGTPVRRDPPRMNETRFSAADLEPSDADLRAARRSLIERTAATLAVLAAGVWVGGMVALGACAAPFVFRLTPAPYSGDAMGSAFARFEPDRAGRGRGAPRRRGGPHLGRRWPWPHRRLRRARRLTAVVMAACARLRRPLAHAPDINALHRAGAQRGEGPQGEELDRTHKTAETVGKAETGLGVLLIALHVFTLAARRPDDEDAPTSPLPRPAPPSPGL